jgi:hypothetical protein
MNNFFYYKSGCLLGSRFCIGINDVASDGFMLALEKNSNLFFRNTHILSAFHAYWKWFNRDHRWLFGTRIW